jgi:DNA-directed RNA polymerase II subunit RPB3
MLLQSGQSLQVEVINPEAYAFDMEPETKAQDMGFPDLVSVRHQPNTFIFKVESTGALRAYNVVCSALDVLASKLENVRLDNDA